MILYSKSLSDYFGQFPRKRHEIINFGQFWDISFSTLRDNINTPYPVADLSGGRGVSPACTPHETKCSQFHAVFGNFWQNHRLVPPPMGNPGSAPDSITLNQEEPDSENETC